MSFEELETRRVLAAFTVSNLLDGPVSRSGDLPGSLRQAVFDANATEGADEIEFEIDEGEIVLSGSPLLVTDQLVVNGPGHSLAVSGNGETRVFVIDDGDNSGNFQFHLNNLTVRNGRSVSIGGGLLSRENLFVDGVVFENNVAGDSGGGVFAEVGFTPDTEISITNVEFRMNVASQRGGGLYVDNFRGGRVTISSTHFQSNEAQSRYMGGAGAFIQNLGVVRVQTSSFQSNMGGGLNLIQERGGNETTTITETTFTNNECDSSLLSFSRRSAALSVQDGPIETSALEFEGNRCGAFYAQRAQGRIERSKFLANEYSAVHFRGGQLGGC